MVVAPIASGFSEARQRVPGVLIALLCSLVLAGCATFGREHPAPVTVGDIVKMSREGVAPDDIIARMRDSGTVYRLRASQFADLKVRGVPDKVIDYMQQTYVNAVRKDQRYEDWQNWSFNNDGYWYGGFPYGWPDGWR